MDIFKSFIIYRQLLFYSHAFAKVRFKERTLPSIILLTTDKAAKLQGGKIWVYISQLKKVLPDIWFWRLKMLETSKSNWFGQEVADTEVGWFLPTYYNQEYFFPFLLPSLTILFLILTSWRFLWYFCPPFVLLWPGIIIRPLQSE